jgi:N6-L-threonylcarbamoyladenine synthase
MLLKKANIQKNSYLQFAFTQGPGLMSSLLVGSSFENHCSSLKHSASANHMQAHVLAFFIDEEG